MKSKTYWAPITAFLYSIFYIIIAIFLQLSAPNYHSLDVIVFCIVLFILYIQQIIRLSYHLEIKDGKIYEQGSFTLKRHITISSITKIRLGKDNFWFSKMYFLSDTDWHKEFHIDSPEAHLPKYTVSKRIIKDLKEIKPDITIEKGGVTFESPFKK